MLLIVSVLIGSILLLILMKKSATLMEKNVPAWERKRDELEEKVRQLQIEQAKEKVDQNEKVEEEHFLQHANDVWVCTKCWLMFDIENMGALCSENGCCPACGNENIRTIYMEINAVDTVVDGYELVKQYRGRGRVFRYNPWNEDADPGDVMVGYGQAWFLYTSRGRHKSARGELSMRLLKPPSPDLVAVIHEGKLWWALAHKRNIVKGQ